LKRKKVYLGALEIDGAERTAAEEVLKRKSLSRHYGVNKPQYVDRLEERFASLTGATYALAVNSGTNGLFVALRACGVGWGDEVLVPCMTFAAPIQAVLACGATVRLVNIDETLNVDLAELEARIGDRTKALLLPHMCGAPFDASAARAIAERHGLYLIEDCAQACGVSFHGKSVGTYGHFGVFSLQYRKVITCGEGGVVVTSSRSLYESAYGVHDLGFRPERKGVLGHDSPGRIGLNFRMDELRAAVAVAQMDKLKGISSNLRDSQARLVAVIGETDGIQWRRSTDAEGDIGTNAVFFLEKVIRARWLVARLRHRGFDANQLYGGLVYECWPHLELKPKSKSTFARSAALLRRMVNINVDPSWTKDELAEVASIVSR